MKRIAFLLLLLLINALPNSAKAFVILPPECRSVGDKCLFENNLRYIFIYGHITYEEYDFFEKLDKYWKKDKPLPVVYVESSGGYAPVALFVGKILHERTGIVVSGNPITKTDGRECASACSVIAAGATERHLSHLGIHQAYKIQNACTKNEQYVPVEQSFYQKLLDHLDYFEAGAKFREYYQYTRFEDMTDIYYWDQLKPEEQIIVEMGYHMAIPPDAKFEIFEQGRPFRQISARQRFEFAIQQGSKGAIYDAIEYYTCEPVKENINYRVLARILELGSKSDPDAAYQLARYYEDGKIEGKSASEAIEIYNQLSKQNHGEALHRLGLLHYEGRIVPKNYRKSVSLLEQAARQWEPAAFGSLCRVYMEHKAVHSNDITAYKWCDLAIKKLDDSPEKQFAIEAIHKLADRMKDHQIDVATDAELPYYFPEIPAATHEYVAN